MKTLIILFWLFTAIVFYTYMGYGIVLYILVLLKRRFGKNQNTIFDANFEPEVTLFISAYNEKDYIADKMENSLALEYPKNKLKIVWVTDGSDDGTPELCGSYEGVQVLHDPERKGKISAMNRGMQFVKTPIVVFSDANAILGKDSIRRMVRLFSNPKVGCVSGEKRIRQKETDTASASGEGFYWKYESALKKWDAEWNTVVGAAGELFAIRTNLYKEVEKDTLLDDFILSLRVAQQGYTVQYDPEAYAIENASANVGEELKRKIRICAGGIQSIIRLADLLNIFKYGKLSFQYISHRVLRWTITPICLLLLLPVNFLLANDPGIFHLSFYAVFFWLQIMFYLFALTGWWLANHSIKVKLLFIPYYFFIMNLSVFLGFFRYIRKSQKVTWEKVKRAA